MFSIVDNSSYHDRQHNITLPKSPSAELAEFIGILAGDGHVTQHGPGNRNKIAIYLNLVDEKEYAEYIRKLALKLFNAKLWSKNYKHDTTLLLAIRSQCVFSFLEQIGFRKKRCIITIPEWIIENEDFARAFIRGLFDTDGCIALKRNHGKHQFYPVVDITSKDKTLIEYVSIWSKRQGIPHWHGPDHKYDKRTNKNSTNYKFQVNGYKNCQVWFSVIGTSNPKNKKRWERRDLNSRYHRLQRCAFPG